MTEKAFYEMADGIASDDSYSLLFNYKYIKPSSGSTLAVKIRTAIYRQAIACIAGIIITLILLFQCLIYALNGSQG